MESFLRDLKLSFRMLAKNPGFALVIVLTLGLGIGANTAVFSLTDQILLRLLPVEKPEELVVLRSPGPKGGHTWSDTDDGAQSFSYLLYKDVRDQNAVFGGLLARFEIPVSVAGQGRTERASGELVSGNYFQVLGVRPALGRLLTPEDDQVPSGHPLVVLSHGYWTRRFGNSPAILNQNLVVNGRSMTVVGVAQATFAGVQLGQSPDVFVPITMKAQMTPNWDGLSDRRDHWLQMLGRLKPGVSREQAEASLAPMFRAVLEQEVTEYKRWSAGTRERFLKRRIFLLAGGQGRLILQGESKESLLILSALVGLVLLIACANIANLLIARGVARQREIAVRLALGAPRGHLVRQLLTESLVLSIAGGVAGLLIAAWSIDAILAALPAEQAIAGLGSKLDLRLLAFNFGIALLTGFLFGLLPALRATRPDLVAALKEQGAGSGASVEHVRLRKGLVVAQIAITAVLLITAGLFTRSMQELRRVDLGVRADNLLTFSVAPELNGYTPGQTIAFFDQLRADLASVPGVTTASLAELPVLADTNAGSNMTVEGYTPQDDQEMEVRMNRVGPGFLAAMGIPLVAGRDFTDADAATSPKVAVINETMARKYFAGQSPIGRKFAFGAGSGVRSDIEIVGVARNSKHATVREEPRNFVYIPYSQNPRIGRATFYVRSTMETGALGATLRQAVARRDANIPVFEMKTLSRQVDESLTGERLLMMLTACFGVLAAVLASVGLYGVMAYTVARRTREIGIRIALGASSRNVRALVLREAIVLSFLGLAIGVPVALAAGRFTRALVFGVRPNDPALLAAASLLLAGVMLLTAYLPARRATRVDPVVALRYE